MRRLLPLAFSLLALAARADVAADYAAIVAGVEGQTSPNAGSPGSVALHGRSAFPVVLSAPPYQYAIEGAGTRNDDFAAGGRAFATGHDGWASTADTVKATLFENAVKWGARKTTPATITIGMGPGFDTAYFTSRGYTVKNVSTTMATPATDLSGCDVFVANWHYGYSASAVTQAEAFAQAGHGILIFATPWALSAQALADANSLLSPAGIALSGSGPGDSSYTVAPMPWPAHHSALPALDELIAEKQGTLTMTLAEKTTAANAVDQSLAANPDQPDVLAQLGVLSNLYGWIIVTAAQPLRRADSPVEAMLARYQSGLFDKLTPAELFVHPCASDWPGLPGQGAPVSRTISVDGTAPADAFVNQGWRGKRVDTGMYAAPGAAITVTIPPALATAGLECEIGIHIDENFHLDQWNRFPKVVRRVPLTSQTTTFGNVFGGLVHLYVPEGACLGTFDVTIDGALEAPVFTRGTDTDAAWVAGKRDAPGAWGYIDSGDYVTYVSRNHLSNLLSPQRVADRWHDVTTTADHYMGYEGFRRRNDSAVTDRDIVAGYGHAGYPMFMAYWDSDVLIDDVIWFGDWGFFHEFGHSYQDDFDGNYTIATHAEVDVNLVPGIIYTKVLDRTAWDGPTHGTYDGDSRLTDRTAWLALPQAQRTWDAACGRTVSYDFYFNLADAFGWDVYGTAFSRLMRFLQAADPATEDPELFGLNAADPNYRRNRFFLLLCRASGHDLTAYFDRYGLGRGSYGITQSVKDMVVGLPVWTDNSPPTALSGPPSVSVPEDAAQGSLLATFTASDPEPGTIWEYTILSGNADGAFAIGKRTGELRVQGLDYEAGAVRNLVVQVQDNGVPRYALQTPITVNITDVVDAPVVRGLLVTADRTMAVGTALGTVVARVDASRTLASLQITDGDAGGYFSLDPDGTLRVQRPTALPDPGTRILTVRATDDAGASATGTVTVLCNALTGIIEERWNGQAMIGDPAYVGTLPTFESAQNVGANYARKLSGWLIPPETGSYTFWISSDDDGELRLSPDANPANAEPIAWLFGWTGVRQWNVYATQQSRAIWLQAGQAYWVEARQVEGGGADHVEAAWQGPGFAQRIIDGSALVPADVPLVDPNADADGDGVRNADDCAVSDASAWSVPGAATALMFPVGGGKVTLQWTAPAAPGGTSPTFGLLRSGVASSFAGATCVASGVAPTATDTALPGAGSAFFYLVSVTNACGADAETPSGAPGCP